MSGHSPALPTILPGSRVPWCKSASLPEPTGLSTTYPVTSLPSPPPFLLLAQPAPATLASLLFLQHARHHPASWPFHWVFSSRCSLSLHFHSTLTTERPFLGIQLKCPSHPFLPSLLYFLSSTLGGPPPSSLSRSRTVLEHGRCLTNIC